MSAECVLQAKLYEVAVYILMFSSWYGWNHDSPSALQSAAGEINQLGRFIEKQTNKKVWVEDENMYICHKLYFLMSKLDAI